MDDVNAGLIAEYAEAYKLQGVEPEEAERQAREFIEDCAKEARQRGWTERPARLGDHLLSRQSEPEVKAALEVLRADGVQDEDFRWWYNLPPVEQVAIEKTDETLRGALFMDLLLEGVSPEEASARVRSVHPICGNPSDGKGDDRPIPWCLKGRILTYKERMQRTPDVYRAKIDGATSFNALIRSEIQAGNL